MFLTGLLVSRNAVKVNYTRKINHFTSLVAPYLLSFLFQSGIASNIDTSIVTEAVQFLNNPSIQLAIPLLVILIKPLCELLAGLLYFVFLLKPARERVRFFETAFLSINRPEDEPHTLFWMVSQLVATYTAAAVSESFCGLLVAVVTSISISSSKLSSVRSVSAKQTVCVSVRIITVTGVSGINRDNFPYRAIGEALALYDL